MAGILASVLGLCLGVREWRRKSSAATKERRDAALTVKETAPGETSDDAVELKEDAASFNNGVGENGKKESIDDSGIFKDVHDDDRKTRSPTTETTTKNPEDVLEPKNPDDEDDDDGVSTPQKPPRKPKAPTPPKASPVAATTPPLEPEVADGEEDGTGKKTPGTSSENVNGDNGESPAPTLLEIAAASPRKSTSNVKVSDNQNDQDQPASKTPEPAAPTPPQPAPSSPPEPGATTPPKPALQPPKSSPPTLPPPDQRRSLKDASAKREKRASDERTRQEPITYGDGTEMEEESVTSGGFTFRGVAK